jgi:hypothetical protein
LAFSGGAVSSAELQTARAASSLPETPDEVTRQVVSDLPVRVKTKAA